MHIELSQALAIGGSVAGFLIGIIIFDLRSALARIEKIADSNRAENETDHTELFKRVSEIEKKLAGLCADHNRVMQGGHFGNKKL